MVNIKYLSDTRNLILAAGLTLLLLNYPAAGYSQKVKGDAPPLRERIFFGGDFGLQFGTITNIDIAPIVGLWVLPRVAVAAGPEYTYYAIKNIGSTSIYGGRVYTQLVLIQDINNIIPAGIHLGLFLHAEDEIQSLESDTPFWVNTGVDSERFNVNALLVGGGISQPMGRRGALNIIALWALNDPYGLYSSPEIRISFTF
jgi:hypothetical protein